MGLLGSIGKIILVPLAMVVPTEKGTYSLSRYQEPKVIEKKDLAKYSQVKVTFAPEEDITRTKEVTGHLDSGGLYIAIEKK